MDSLCHCSSVQRIFLSAFYKHNRLLGIKSANFCSHFEDPSPRHPTMSAPSLSVGAERDASSVDHEKDVVVTLAQDMKIYVL